jgi:WD40 repeat protein
MAQSSSQVFISYHRADLTVAERVRAHLMANGVKTWMDHYDIPAGAYWPDEIDRGLNPSQLATGGSDGLIRLWDVATLQVMGQLPRAQQGFIIWLFFTPDGRYLISDDLEGDVVSVDMNVTTWTTRACAIAARNLSREEWTQFLGEEVYHTTCPDLPSADRFPVPPVPAATTPAMPPVAGML